MTQSEEFRPGWDEYFMLQAHIAKLRSNCSARKVGAVIIKDRRQIATGYNGTPPGIKNCFEGGCQRCLDRKSGKVQSRASYDTCLCNHAEENAILQCALMGNSSKNSALYCTFSPCLPCAKMIVTSGIRRVVCIDTYEDSVSNLFAGAQIDFVTIDTNILERWRGAW